MCVCLYITYLLDLVKFGLQADLTNKLGFEYKSVYI